MLALKMSNTCTAKFEEIDESTNFFTGLKFVAATTVLIRIPIMTVLNMLSEASETPVDHG
jgi:hypothetical protein